MTESLTWSEAPKKVIFKTPDFNQALCKQWLCAFHCAFWHNACDGVALNFYSAIF
jgi:hypothetical protein